MILFVNLFRVVQATGVHPRLGMITGTPFATLASEEGAFERERAFEREGERSRERACMRERERISLREKRLNYRV